jgi:hypothetical protein
MRQFLIFLVLILVMSCIKRRSNDKIEHFINDSAISSIDGKPLDSLSFYFPKKLFVDSIRYFVYDKDTVDFKSNQNLDTLIKYRKLIKEKVQVLDTLRIEAVTFFAEPWSFALFKMKEPILYNYDLHKEIYRLIIDQSFNKFLVIHIEKNNDSIFVTTKGLNRRVGYPFIKYEGLTVIYEAKGAKKISQKEKDRIQYRDDSIARIYNNTDYFIDLLISRKITEQQWSELQSKLEKISFWNSYPKTCGSCMQIDGSRWVLEGQSKIGYQIHEVVDPFDKYDDKNEYSDLFKFIVNISGLEIDKFRFY